MTKRPVKQQFGLTPQAVRFARLYAENPTWTVTQCAIQAGYADNSRAAHVRANELLRDPRVSRAISHFATLAFGAAEAKAALRLRLLAEGTEGYMSGRDKVQLRNFLIELGDLKARIERLGQINEIIAA